jgi:DNA-binding response OmpR family regulator
MRDRIATLLIESQTPDADLISATLQESHGFDYCVIVQKRLDAAKAFLAENAVDLILLDLTLPNGAGVALVKEIKALSPSTPLVVVTGLDDDDVEIEALQHLAQDYIVKGRQPAAEFRRRIRNAIIRHRATATCSRLSHAIDEMEGTLRKCEESPHLPPYSDVPGSTPATAKQQGG